MNAKVANVCPRVAAPCTRIKPVQLRANGTGTCAQCIMHATRESTTNYVRLSNEAFWTEVLGVARKSPGVWADATASQWAVPTP